MGGLAPRKLRLSDVGAEIDFEDYDVENLVEPHLPGPPRFQARLRLARAITETL